MPDRCGGCGLEIAGGTAGCQAIFDSFLARDFTSPAYFRAHRLLVDTYSMQHPDKYCVSAKSFAAHFMGLCRAVEQGGPRAIGDDALRRWLDGPKKLEKPALPPEKGRLTIIHARDAADARDYGLAVERWALETWHAYEPLHGLARRWIAEALVETGHIQTRGQ